MIQPKHLAMLFISILILGLVPVTTSDQATFGSDIGITPDYHNESSLYQANLRDSYTSTPSITVTGDAAMTTFASNNPGNVNGTGTSQDPYVIYGFNVTYFNFNSFVSTHLVLTQNLVNNSNTYGIYLFDMVNVTISHNIILHVFSQAVYTYSTGTSNVVIEHNYIEDAMAQFVYAYGTGVTSNKFLTITDNEMYLTNADGIYFFNYGEIYVSNNQLSFIDNSGIYISTPVGFDIDTNTISNAKFDGIYISGGTGTGNVTNNQVDMVLRDGINVGGCCSAYPSQVLIEGNSVNSRFYSLRIGSTGNIIDGNYLQSTEGYANIYTEGSAANLTITSNEMFGGGFGFGGGSSIPNLGTLFFDLSGNSLNSGTVEFVNAANGVSYDATVNSINQFIVYNSSHIEITGYAFQGVHVPILISQSNNISVSSSSFRNIYHGLFIDTSSDLSFEDLTMSHSVDRMVILQYVSNATFTTMTMEWSGNTMITSNYNSHLTFSQINARGGQGYLLYSFSDNNMTIEDSYAQGFQDSIIFAQFGSDLIISNNVFRDSYETIVNIYYFHGLEMTGNIFSEGYTYGVSIDNVMQGLIHNNLFHGSYLPVYAYNLFNTLFTDNHVVSHHPGSVMYLSFGEDIASTHQHNLTITGNTFMTNQDLNESLLDIGFVAYEVIIDGNYYSNYDGVGSYDIGSLSDNNPLSVPAFTVDQLEISGTDVQYTEGETGNSITFS
ncbi:MAG: right-handed parallel beta-helix repeat-containing protein, partial [Candidatus Kariarchaeaceae archaeon]